MMATLHIHTIPLHRMRFDVDTGVPEIATTDRILRLADNPADPGSVAYILSPSSEISDDILQRVLRNRRVDYRFRTPLGFSPLGLFDLRPVPLADRWLDANRTVLVRRPAVVKSGAYPVQERQIWIEEASLYPIIFGRDLKPFRAPWKELRCVPLPWKQGDPDLLDAAGLASRPLQKAYLDEYKDIISTETQRDDQRLVATHWFHPTRFGPYQIYPWKVLVRTNTRWCAAVVGSIDMPWTDEYPGGARRMVVPGLKASFISERRLRPKGVGPAIVEDEAHYIAAVLNATPHRILIEATNSPRSYSLTNPPLHLPLFDCANPIHRDLAILGREASGGADRLRAIDELFLRLLPR
jgi:hypothetical protein